MRERIEPIIQDTTSLIQIQEKLLSLFETITQEGYTEIGYVAGIITSDGPKHIDSNMQKLTNTTNRIKNEYDIPVFSSPYIFSADVYEKLQEMNLSHEEREQAFYEFYKGLLESGYITKIFMTSRWEKSRGATFEHEIAQRQGLQIYYVESE